MVFSFQHVYSWATLAIIFHYFLATDDGARQVALDRDHTISPSVDHLMNIRYKFHDRLSRRTVHGHVQSCNHRVYFSSSLFRVVKERAMLK